MSDIERVIGEAETLIEDISTASSYYTNYKKGEVSIQWRVDKPEYRELHERLREIACKLVQLDVLQGRIDRTALGGLVKRTTMRESEEMKALLKKLEKQKEYKFWHDDEKEDLIKFYKKCKKGYNARKSLCDSRDSKGYEYLYRDYYGKEHYPSNVVPTLKF
jgi:hypothetical protein